MEYTHARDIDEYADRVPDRYLACRVNGHSRTSSSIGEIADMDVHESIKEIRGGTFLKTMRCRNRCGITWTSVLDDTGRILWETGPNYGRAPGYLTRGMGRFTREYKDRLRLEEALRRVGRKLPGQ